MMKRARWIPTDKSIEDVVAKYVPIMMAVTTEAHAHVMIDRLVDDIGEVRAAQQLKTAQDKVARVIREVEYYDMLVEQNPLAKKFHTAVRRALRQRIE